MDYREQIIGLDTLVETNHGKRPYINFDNAATTPPCKEALDTLVILAPLYASAHRGSGFKSDATTAAYEHARHTIGSFVGAQPGQHVVIFCKNTTEAINKLAYRSRFAADDVVLVSGAEHHSNDLPWRSKATVYYIRVLPNGDLDEPHYLALLRQFGRRIKLVAVTGASNVTGAMPDIHWMARKAHEVGAKIFVDCAQLGAHAPISMGDLRDPAHLDYIALSAHKMYAPFGSGALVGRKDTFEEGSPDHAGGGTVTFVTHQTVDWAETPGKDEAGTPNVLGVVAFAAAVQFLQSIGFQNIIQKERELTRYALAHLHKIPGITVYGDTNTRRLGPRSCIIPFAIEGWPPYAVAEVLGDEYGIGVRSGCFCAQPYVACLLGVQDDSKRLRALPKKSQKQLLPGLVRISLAFYNTTDEIDELCIALEKIASRKFDTTRKGIY